VKDWSIGDTPRRLRVVFLLPALDVGGAERVVARTVRRLDKARFEPIVAAFIRGSGRLLSELDGIETVVLGESRGPLLGWHLLRFLHRSHTDVLLTFMFHANTAGRLAGRLAGVPIIVSSERVVGWESHWRIVVNRLTIHLTDAVTTNSSAGRDFWSRRLRHPIDNVHVIYNGVDLDQFPAHTSRRSLETRFGVLARFHRANGHRWLLDGLRCLHDRTTAPWTCEFAGDGPERAYIENTVQQMGLSNRVIFSGFCRDASSFLRSLDAYIHPALVAGMPNAVLEAMATGLPVIATAVGGTVEAILHGATGWLVTPGDVETFTERAAYVVSNPPEAVEIGSRARRRVEEVFSLDASVRSTEHLLENLVHATLGLSYTKDTGWRRIS
jgi:glycosyltransferase involved in cell wall biosynthesis